MSDKATTPGWENIEDDLPSEVVGESPSVPAPTPGEAAQEVKPTEPEKTEDKTEVEQSVTQPPPAPTPGEAAQEESSEYPKDWNECIKLLKKLEALPEATAKQQRDKEAKLAPLKKHIFQIQQGLPTISIDSHGYGHSVARQNLERTRWEYLARTDLSVKKLLAERDALEKQVAELQAQLKSKA